MDIIFENVKKSFGDKLVLNDFNLKLKENEISCIMGSSGSGKTTIINLILGFLKPDAGKITAPNKFSVMFQEDRLCEDFTAIDNIAMVFKKPNYTEIKSHLAQIGIDDEYKAVKDFSGGMKRRVALVRALMFDSKVIILDEPFKGLDEDTRKLCIDYILKHRDNRTLVMITHHLEEVELMGGKVISI